MPTSIAFEPDEEYIDAYFLVIDIKGHSDIVRRNDADKVERAFDEFERVVRSAIQRETSGKRCQISSFWGWQGDGGLCVLYDKDESVSRVSALGSAYEILAEIPSLNERLHRDDLNGNIHVKIAIHKGNFRYKEEPGSIHSKDLNLISHVEKFVPYDSIAISHQVYSISGRTQSEFTEVGEFEGTKFYLSSTLRASNEIKEEWRAGTSIAVEKAVGIESNVPRQELGLIGVFSQRALTERYVTEVQGASTCIWLQAISFGAFQKDQREQDLLKKALEGVDIRLLAADPEVVVRIESKDINLQSWRDYELGGGDSNVTSLKTLVEMVERINRSVEQDKVHSNKKYVRMKYYRTLPTSAIMRIDSIVYTGPYFAKCPSVKTYTLAFSDGGRLFDQCIQHFKLVWYDSFSRDADIFQGSA